MQYPTSLTPLGYMCLDASICRQPGVKFEHYTIGSIYTLELYHLCDFNTSEFTVIALSRLHAQKLHVPSYSYVTTENY